MDERIYQIGLVILLIGELVFSVPTMIDSIVGTEDMTLVMVLLMGHVIVYMYGNMYRLHSFRGYVHFIGGGAFLGSFIPMFGFILHFIVVIVIFNELRKMFKNKQNKTRG